MTPDFMNLPLSESEGRSVLDDPPLSLRDHLKRATSANHDRVDSLFSTLDLTTVRGLGHFLAAHRSGFAAMRPSLVASSGLVDTAMLDEMIDAVDADLRGLSREAQPLTIAPVTSDAVDHIILGSRLGTAVLRRQWDAATDPLVKSASAYFSLPGAGSLWRQHTERLHARPLEDEGSALLVEDTKRLYHLFETAYHNAG